MNDDESEESYQWSANERRFAKEETDRRTRLMFALDDCRKIVDSSTSGDYKKYILRSSRHLKRYGTFRPGVTEEEQLAEEFILRSLFGFAVPGSEGNGEELMNVTKAFRERSKHKIIPPEDSELFNWPRYIDFKKYPCPREDLVEILRFVDSLAYALCIIHAVKLTQRSKGRQKVRVGREWYNLKFVCYTVAIRDTLDLLEKNPDLAEKIVGSRFQKPFDNLRPSRWIELSGIPRASFYGYWHLVTKTVPEDFAYFYKAATTLPTAFHQTHASSPLLTEGEKNLLDKIQSSED